jgi:hypothetical protein
VTKKKRKKKENKNISWDRAMWERGIPFKYCFSMEEL